MRIAVYSRFYPSVGGIETITRLLVEQWVQQGCQIVLVSDVAPPAGPHVGAPIRVLYQPAPITRLRIHRQAQLVVHMNISLKALWPAMLIRRPLVAVHHGFYVCDRSGRQDWCEKLKLGVARRAKANVAVSKAVAERTHLKCAVIPNAYDDSLFNQSDPTPRNTELVFVGRLVSDKGCDSLLLALARLRTQGLKPGLTIIGDGPERGSLEAMRATLALTAQVRFAGALSQERVAEELRRHTVLVVPSLWEEPFGIVALEGAACGCVVLGSDGGGLPEAIGPAGMVYQRGDTAALAEKLKVLLLNPSERDKCRAAAPAHLAKHSPDSIANRYLNVFRQVLER